jgi:hypothetical protein
MPSATPVPKPHTEHMRTWAASLMNTLTRPAGEVNWEKAKAITDQLSEHVDLGMHHYSLPEVEAALEVATPAEDAKPKFTL